MEAREERKTNRYYATKYERAVNSAFAVHAGIRAAIKNRRLWHRVSQSNSECSGIWSFRAVTL